MAQPPEWKTVDWAACYLVCAMTLGRAHLVWDISFRGDSQEPIGLRWGVGQLSDWTAENLVLDMIVECAADLDNGPAPALVAEFDDLNGEERLALIEDARRRGRALTEVHQGRIATAQARLTALARSSAPTMEHPRVAEFIAEL